ncbi:MAG: SET domain-containing protein [Halobacteriales archaeon]|nr:SET domain-containing protein [Halobacteriales archaeon]
MAWRFGPSGIHGKGVFADRALDPRAALFRVHGDLVPWSRVSQRGYQVWRDWYVEPAARSPSRILNHACQPSCEVTARLDIRARRRIAPGEELTIDYASVVLWEPWRMACACGQEGCRGEVRAWGRSPEEVRARYPMPLFSFVERGRVPPGLPGPLREAAARAAGPPGARGRGSPGRRGAGTGTPPGPA